jgi:23S rRNA A2030 N6-methylase RlmJ
MIIKNPPFVLKGECKVFMPWLVETLAQDESSGWRFERLTKE